MIPLKMKITLRMCYKVMSLDLRIDLSRDNCSRKILADYKFYVIVLPFLRQINKGCRDLLLQFYKPLLNGIEHAHKNKHLQVESGG